MQMVLEDVKERLAKREEKWERYKEFRVKRGQEDDGPFRNQNETIELALNLNLDPRKPGQALRGSLVLPHGSGKTLQCVVFTESKQVAQEALENGAIHAGGEELVDSIQNGTVPLNFDRALASPDMMGVLGPLARTLGPRGLMPNAKVGTLVPTEQMIEALKQQAAGQVQYRTEKAGIVHLPIGKGSFSQESLLENARAVLEELHEVKPENFGKGKKGKKASSSKNQKYLLKAHLSSTQGKGVRLDLRTVDPTSNYFMSVAPDA